MLILNITYFRWDFEPESDRLSPWDLEPIDEERRPTKVGDGVPVLPSEIFGTLYRPRPEDWGGDRETECDRISAALDQVMKMAIAEPFSLLPVDLNLRPYPMDLTTIKQRLDNRFYRRISAVLFDFSYVFTKSNNIRSTSINKNLCLEIIGTRDAVPAIYQRLLEKYELREGGAEENADGPGTSEVAITSNTRSRSRRNLKISESQSEKEKSKSNKSRNAVATCKSKVNVLNILRY